MYVFSFFSFFSFSFLLSVSYIAHTIEPYTSPATTQNLTSTHGPPVPQQKSRITNAPIYYRSSGDSGSRSAPSTDPPRAQMRQKSSVSNVVTQQGNPQASSGGGNDGATFRNRMQRLQDLVLELNWAISENGEDSSRALELRGRIAELTREDAQSSGIVSQGGVTVPPPYEPNRRSVADP